MSGEKTERETGKVKQRERNRKRDRERKQKRSKNEMIAFATQSESFDSAKLNRG